MSLGSVRSFLTAIQQGLDVIPLDQALAVRRPAGALDLMGTEPVACFEVATNDSEVTTLQGVSGLTRFIDARSNTLYEYIGGSWQTRTYTGDEAFLLPEMLIYSTHFGRMFFTDQYLKIAFVNLGTSVSGPSITYA